MPRGEETDGLYVGGGGAGRWTTGVGVHRMLSQKQLNGLLDSAFTATSISTLYHTGGTGLRLLVACL